MSDNREALLARTFVALADSLVDHFDVIELLQKLVDSSTELFDASASGITLGPDDEHLEVVVSTSDESQFMGLMQVRAGEGPCVQAVTTGRVVSVDSLAAMRERWPVFARAIADSHSSFVSVHAIPLRLRGQTIGSLNLFREHEGELNVADSTAAQALADVATIAILQERAIRDRTVMHEQLQRALDTRVVIEQAKGIVAHQHGLEVDEAYRLIRHHARSTQAALSGLAADIVAGNVELAYSRPPVD